MVPHEPPATPDDPDVRACRSAVVLLRADPQPIRADREQARYLAELLNVVGAELEADGGSLPTAVRCAAVQLAVHVVQRAATPAPGAAGECREGGHAPRSAADHARAIPFSRSLRLGRMG